MRAPKPNLRDASCCKVDVMNGAMDCGYGLLRRVLTVRSRT
jgi:hypothetical protein